MKQRPVEACSQMIKQIVIYAHTEPRDSTLDILRDLAPIRRKDGSRGGSRLFSSRSFATRLVRP